MALTHPTEALADAANKTERAYQLRAAIAISMAMDPPPKGPPLAFTERMAAMAEPSTSAAGGFALWKLFGGLAGFAGLAAFLAAVVSMCMMTPRNPREWAVGIISTVVISLGGGALAILKLGLLTNLPTEPVSQFVTLVAVLGVVFACGLPGWAIVRALFTWIERRKDKDLGELVSDARAVVAGRP